MALVLFHHRLAWVSMAPLGCPVVPDVYMISATSSASTGSASDQRLACLGCSGSQPSAGLVGQEPPHAELAADRVDDAAVRRVGDRACGSRRRR